ncbi:MAG TPA: Rieske 2Fe-2S domain-containing protein [Thermoanaerobaculia bacterium]|nr:Rieske 2Fe-2S domain-containing protein [Thermoanaerobaculia bacterium]
MTRFIEIAKIEDIPVGRVRSFNVDGKTIAVYHTSDGFFATDNTCPHRGGPLAEGDLMGNEIVCPWHLWGFDVRSGACTGNPEIAIVTHDVTIADDRVLVNL